MVMEIMGDCHQITVHLHQLELGKAMIISSTYPHLRRGYKIKDSILSLAIKEVNSIQVLFLLTMLNVFELILF